MALTAWADEGWFSLWRSQVAHLMPPPQPGSARPEEWSDPAETKRRFESVGLDAAVGADAPHRAADDECRETVALQRLRQQRLLVEVGRGWFDGAYGYEGVFHELEALLRRQRC